MNSAKGGSPAVSRGLMGAAVLFCLIIALPDLSPGLAESDLERGTAKTWKRWEERGSSIRRDDLANKVQPFLSHSDTRVRRQAAELIARLEDPSMLDVLRQAYLDGQLVRNTYAFAMENIRNPQGLPYLERQVLVQGDESLGEHLEKQIERVRLRRDRWGSRPRLSALIELHADALAFDLSPTRNDGGTPP